MFDEANDTMEAILNDERMMKNVALIIKKLYDELIELGFDDDQAAIIVANYKAG
jgi:hypothetical protein